MFRNKMKACALAACAFAVMTPAAFAAEPTVSSPGAPVAVNADSYLVEGTADADALVQVWIDANNNGALDLDEALTGSQQLAGGETAYSISVLLVQDAVNNFVVTSTDAAGIQSVTDVPAISEDSVSPTASAEPVGGLYNSAQSVSLSASESGTIHYTTDGSEPSTSSAQYLEPISVSETTTLKFFTTDRAGNSSPISSEEYTIDTEAPSGTVAINGGATYTNSRTLTVAVPASDAISGVSEVRLSNSPEMSGAELMYGESYPYTDSLSWTLADTASGTYTVYVQWRDTAGNWSSVASDSIALDKVAPVADAPLAGFAVPSTLTPRLVPVRLGLAGVDDLSGIARYDVQLSSDGIKWTSLRSTISTNLNWHLFPGKNYQFRARAIDQAGNVSPWAAAPSFKIGAYQESSRSIVYSGQWKSTRLKEAYANALRYTSVAGSRASFGFTASRVGWVAQKSPTGGQAEVYIDGAYVTTVDLYSASKQQRQVVFRQAGLDPTVSHTLEVRALGTKSTASKGTIVSVDAFLTLP